MIHVPYVECKLLVPREAITAFDLRPSRNARLEVMPAALEIVVARYVLGKKRTGSYKTHIAFQNIPQLRKLVKAACSEKAAEARQTEFVRQRIPVCISGINHRCEFQECESNAVLAGAKLAEKHRAPHEQANADRESRYDRRHNYNKQSSQELIDYAFVNARV